MEVLMVVLKVALMEVEVFVVMFVEDLKVVPKLVVVGDLVFRVDSMEALNLVLAFHRVDFIEFKVVMIMEDLPMSLIELGIIMEVEEIAVGVELEVGLIMGVDFKQAIMFIIMF